MKNMKRIHSITIKRMVDEEYNLNQDQPSDCIGIRADAEVFLGHPTAPHLIQVVTSGGLWGINLGSGLQSSACYLAEIEQEQLDELREQLHAIGFSKRAISAATKNVERVSR